MRDEWRDLHREIATAIATRIEDPAGWLLELRRMGDALDLPTQKWLRLPATLEDGCFALVGYASYDSRITVELIREAAQ